MSKHIAIVAACAAVVTVNASAAVLTGSGPNLPIPSPNPGSPNGIGNSLVPGGTGFTGSWTSPVLADWIGTYTADGPIPSSNANPAGVTRYDFTSLPTGVLPAGTFFWIGDVDLGAGNNESFTITALDAGGSLITTPWLDEPIGVTPAFPAATHMPGWNWDGAGTYFFDGTTVTSNPSVGIFMPSNTGIATMVVDRPFNTCNFNLWAPVPAPSALALLGAAGLVTRRRR